MYSNHIKNLPQMVKKLEDLCGRRRKKRRNYIRRSSSPRSWRTWILDDKENDILGMGDDENA